MEELFSSSQTIELDEIRADKDSTKDIVYSEENFAITSGDKFDSQIREAEGADGYHSVLHRGQSDSDDGEEQPAGCSKPRKKYFAYRVKKSEEWLLTSEFLGLPKLEIPTGVQNLQISGEGIVMRDMGGNAKPEAKSIVADFISNSASQGLSHIQSAPAGLKKIFWLLVYLAAMTCLTIHLTRLIHRYIQYDTSTETELLSEPSVPYPAVTICNSNIRREVPNLGNTAPGEGDFDYLLDDRLDFAHFNSAEGHQLMDLIVSATFNNKRIAVSEENFQLVKNPFFGNCYTFNMNGTLYTYQEGGVNGLSLILNIEKYHYLKYGSSDLAPAQWVGAVVKVHPPDQAPLAEIGDVDVQPNTKTKIVVKRSKLLRLGGPYGECIGDADVYNYRSLTYSPYGYSKVACQKRCLQLLVVEECCCYIKIFHYDENLLDLPDEWDSVRNNGTLSCNRGLVKACNDSERCWKDVWNQHNGAPDCDECLDTCNQTMYDLQIGNVIWPSDEYLQHVLNELTHKGHSVTDVMQEQSLDNVTAENVSIKTEEFFRGNYLTVNVYYGSMTSLYVNEIPQVAPIEFISELGGALGLWAGWTVYTILEFIIFISDLAVISIRKKKNQ